MTVAFNKILGRPCIVASLACVSASSWEQGAVFTVCTVKVQTACNTSLSVHMTSVPSSEMIALTISLTSQNYSALIF